MSWRHNIYGVTDVTRNGGNTYFTLAPGAKAAADLQTNMFTPSSYSWIENAYEFLNSYTNLRIKGTMKLLPDYDN